MIAGKSRDEGRQGWRILGSPRDRGRADATAASVGTGQGARGAGRDPEGDGARPPRHGPWPLRGGTLTSIRFTPSTDAARVICRRRAEGTA